LGESYSGIRALADLFMMLQSTNKLFGAVAGNGSYTMFGLSHPHIFFIFFPSTFTPATLGAAIHFTALYPNG